jgi:ribose 5-phosphate isomerase B
MAEQRAITEREVRRAAREGVKMIDIRGAIVTPGARTAARELGILFTGPDAPTSVLPMRAYGSFDPTPVARVTIALACEPSGTAIKDAVAARLYQMENSVNDLVAGERPPKDSADAAALVTKEVAESRAQFGIIVNGTGIGACIAANKVRGIRAALCHDVTTAISAREHHDANVLCLAGGLIGPRLATAIVETFLTRSFAEARYGPRLAKLKALDEGRR